LEEDREQLDEGLLEFIGQAVQDLQQDPGADNQERIERLRYAIGQIKALMSAAV